MSLIIAAGVLTAAFAGDDPLPPAKAGPNGIVFYRRFGALQTIDPDGKKEEPFAPRRRGSTLPVVKLSPDGSKAATVINDRLVAATRDDREPPADLGRGAEKFAWSPDGKQLACSFSVGSLHETFEKPDRPLAFENYVLDVATKKETPLKLPPNHFLTDWSRDGKTFLTGSVVIERGVAKCRLHEMNRDGTERKTLTEPVDAKLEAKYAPDGHRVMYVGRSMPHRSIAWVPLREITILDTQTGKATKVKHIAVNAHINDFCWSPDGKRIAFVWREVHPKPPAGAPQNETGSFLVVCDPDGGNAKTIARDSKKGDDFTLGDLDWR